MLTYIKASVNIGKAKTMSVNFNESFNSKIMQFTAELKQDNANLKAELKEDIAKSKVDIIKWVFGLQFATLALIAGMLKLML